MIPTPLVASISECFRNPRVTRATLKLKNSGPEFRIRTTHHQIYNLQNPHLPSHTYSNKLFAKNCIPVLGGGPLWRVQSVPQIHITTQHKEGTNILFELSAPVGEWCITVCSWLSNSVGAPASDRRNSASCDEMKSATQSDAVLRAGGRLSSRASSDYSLSSVLQTRQRGKGKKKKKQSRDCPCSGKLFKVSSGTGCFPFLGGDIKVGGVLKRLPAHSDSFPTKSKRIIRLSGVSFKDMSISSNFKSHRKQNFETKEGTNKARTVDGRHALPSRTLAPGSSEAVALRQLPCSRHNPEDWNKIS